MRQIPDFVKAKKMNRWKLLAAFCITTLVIVNLATSSAQAGPFIGPTQELKADIVEYAGVDSSKPDTPSTSLTIHGDSSSNYLFVKMDLSRLPPIETIFVVSAHLSFHVGGWSGAGTWGYASVASHYCEDDSWTKDALTWNNKPTFDPQPTDTWGFAIIYTFVGEPRVGFMIEADVVKTLESGDTLLTEAITWGAGTGTTTLSDPELKIVYANRPVYELILDAVCDVPYVNVSETRLIRMRVADQVFGGPIFVSPVFPKSEYASPGTYDLQFQGRCKFAGWQTSGGVTASNPSEPLTQLTIDSDGALTAKCSLDWVVYGDEDVDGAAYGSHLSSESYAEKYSPLVSGYLRLVRVYVIENPVPFELHILGMSDDPTKKAPVDIAPAVTAEPTRNGWVEVDLTSQKIRVERDHPYYISITWLTDEKPVFAQPRGIPEHADLYSFRNNTWEKFYHAITIQHLVSTSLEERVKFVGSGPTTETSPTITTQTSATVTRSPSRSTTTATPSAVPPETFGGQYGLWIVAALVFIAAMVATTIFLVRRKGTRIGRPSPPAVTARGGIPPAGVKYCIQCGELIPEVALYCPRCASKQEQ